MRTQGTAGPEAVRLADDVVAVSDYLYDHGMTDGLPVVPPTRERVEAMLEFTDLEPDESLGIMPPGYNEARVDLLAINAVMAGCQPEYFPVIIAAVQAMLQKEFNLFGCQATTHVVAPLVIVNGPIAQELCIAGGVGCFGPGFKANATIGRALRLILMNVGGAYPGLTDKATFGSPAKFTYVIAENERESPYAPLHVERGYPADVSTVTVIGCEAPHNINDHGSRSADELLTTIASVMSTSGHNDAYLCGNPVLVLGPEHAATIARDGVGKEDIRAILFERARIPYEKFSRGNAERFKTMRPDPFATAGPGSLIPPYGKPEDLVIVVAGGPGKHSLFIPTFGDTRMVTRPIARREGTPLRSVRELVGP